MITFSVAALFVLNTTIPVQAFAAGAQDELDYPELTVTPRASERLDMESKKETNSRWTKFIPLQVSALSTFTAGLLYSAKPTTNPLENPGAMKFAGLAVGGGWIAATLVLSAMHTPYQSSNAEVSALPKGTTREKLTRERLAEEAIDGAASLGRKLTWLSVITNVGANAAMLSKVESGSFSMILCGVGAAAAFTPLIFGTNWGTVAAEQREYKKKIYAPVASFIVVPSPEDGSPLANASLSFRF